jgi:hypothetical protein
MAVQCIRRRRLRRIGARKDAFPGNKENVRFTIEGMNYIIDNANIGNMNRYRRLNELDVYLN